VIDGGVEIRVVADDGRKLHNALSMRTRNGSTIWRLRSELRVIGLQQFADSLAKRRPMLVAQRHERVERIGCAGVNGRRSKGVEQARLSTGAQVQNVVSDGNAMLGGPSLFAAGTRRTADSEWGNRFADCLADPPSYEDS